MHPLPSSRDDMNSIQYCNVCHPSHVTCVEAACRAVVYTHCTASHNTPILLHSRMPSAWGAGARRGHPIRKKEEEIEIKEKEQERLQADLRKVQCSAPRS
ncbi:hypothetical protein SETIT_1G122600v2 [Setaria italica]|uniref:Uncharacterized protein n=1 Tax=Setaria italica TaxID=4555 RepID=A0A368PKD0_SETIT|nr:hypothetical protein SETIT_1G122600v2 [Setaria italica]